MELRELGWPGRLVKSVGRRIKRLVFMGQRSTHLFRPVNFTKPDASPEALARDIDYALQVGRNYCRQLAPCFPLGGKTILEIGPGINFGSILFLAGHGAIPTVADFFLSPWDADYHPAFYRGFHHRLRLDHPELDLRPLEAILDAGDYPADVLRREKKSLESTDLPTDSIDITISNAVFEHLFDHAKAFEQLFRITKPGGSGFHQVDFRFHPSFERPLEHLLLPAWRIEDLVRAADHEWGTLLRPYEMVALIGQVGFEDVKFSANSWAEPEYFREFLARLRKQRRSRYRRTAEEDLRPISGLLLVRKPRPNGRG